MADKKKTSVSQKYIAVIIIVIVALVISLTFVVFGHGNTTGSTIDTKLINGTSEMYLFIAPNYDSTNLVTKTLEDGTNFSYNMPGSRFNFTLNTTIDIAIFIINHEHQAMNYSIMAYQASPGQSNDSVNLTPLFYSPCDVIHDGEARQSIIHINPAYVSNNSKIGITLFDSPLNNKSRTVNNTEFDVIISP